VSVFAGLPEQPRAQALLAAAVGSPAHAYLLFGPAGSGKRRHADRFAAALLGCPPHRVEARTHPDLFVLEPEGQGILIEGARRLRRDLHLRPFEADRRVYLILDAHLLRDESANALLKSLEEPPEYGVIVLVSDHAERMLATIRSRLQAIEFRRYPASALAAATGDPVAARAALGNLDRALELSADPAAAARRRTYLELARSAAADEGFDAAAACAAVLAASGERAKAEASAVGRERDARLESVDDPKDEKALRRRYEDRAKREARRAEWDELRLAVDTIGLWYHDLLAAALGAADAVLNADTAEALPAAAASPGAAGHAQRALDVLADVRRSLELNVHPALAIEALFHRLAAVRSPAAEGAAA
jgi:DNA polymerase III subunit delta'